MHLADVVLVGALLVWSLALVRASIDCLQSFDAGLRGRAVRRWCFWPVALLAHYLSPWLSVHARLRARDFLNNAGVAIHLTPPHWYALRCWCALGIGTAATLPLQSFIVHWSLVLPAPMLGWFLPPALLWLRMRWHRVVMRRELRGYRERLQVAVACGCAPREALQLSVEWGRSGPTRDYFARFLLEGRPRRNASVPAAILRFAEEVARACTAGRPAEYTSLAAATHGLSVQVEESTRDNGYNDLINENLFSDGSAGPGNPLAHRLRARDHAIHRGYARAPPL